MLASQAETGVWVQAPGKGVLGRVREGVAPPAAGVRGITSGKKFEIVYAKSCNLVHFGVLKHFNNGNVFLYDIPLFG